MQDKWIKKIMNKLPFVDWDRFIDLDDFIEVYGWIDREKDNYKDFVLLEFDMKKKVGYCLATSSSKYSKEICKLLGEKHIDCVPVDEKLRSLK